MGRFTLRLPESLHEELEARARKEGVSLNQYVVYALTRQVASAYTIQVLPEEAVKEQRERYETLLANLGESSLSATKAFLAERDAAGNEADSALGAA
ncbi:MAG: YlcI/YnfO family protein [Rubricoccaceae bacterium]|nr:YlcI/YnfO family protein [Rubricoccaceae bacterium]